MIGEWRKRDLIKAMVSRVSTFGLLFNLLRVGMENLKSNGSEKEKRHVGFFLPFWGEAKEIDV